jgi:hypothetical protein
MSHRSVVQLIKDTAVSIADNIQFGYGRRSDFNLQQNPSQPWIWLLPLTANPTYTNNNNTENYQKTWNCIVLFAAFDESAGTEKETKVILDTTDELADIFINRLNDWSNKTSDTVGAVTLRNFQQNPFIKSDADVFTGWFISFQLVVSDDFDYCTPDNEVLYAN